MTDTRNLINLVATDSDVLALVPVTRIHSWPSPQDTDLPFINYRELNRRPATRISGRPASESVLIEINVFSSSTAELKNIIKEVVEAVELGSVVESITAETYIDETDARRQSVTVSYHADR